MTEATATNLSKDTVAGKSESGLRERAPHLLALGLEARLLSLQRTIGNHAVGKLLQSVNATSQLPGALLQRKCTSCTGGGAKCSTCREEEHLQRKATGPDGSSIGVNRLPQVVNEALGNRSGSSIDHRVRGLMESRFKHDFSQVRIHHDALANRAAASINAAAFTVGNSIWFGAGQYQTANNRGLYLLAHELAHTIQQRGQASSVQGRLNIGSVEDSAEDAADRAADAVMKNRNIPALGAVRPMLRRVPLPFNVDQETLRQSIPEISPTEDPDTVEVEFQRNSYRVRRRVTGLRHECKKVEANEAPSLSADFDSSNAWAQVEWCTTGGRSIRGRVRFGADIPAALQRTIRSLIVDGGRDPRTVLNNLDITPFIEVDVARSEDVRVRARAEATVRPGTGEVRGGRGSVGIDVPGGTLEFEISGTAPERPGEPPNLQGGFRLTFPFGSRSQPVRCRDVEVCRDFPVYELACVRRIPERQVPHFEERFVYFEYATDVVATRDSSTGRNRRAENNRAAEQNEREITRIQELINDGWQVSSIRGFTSPEGPRRRESRFIGNQKLSENRATAARGYIEGLCNPGVLTMRRRTCFLPEIPVTGEGELLTAESPTTGRELEGAPLATQATPRFLGSEEERSRRTPELEHAGA